MKTSALGVEFIKREEGLRLEMYDDVAGFGSVGWGHLVRPEDDIGVVITEQKAEELLTQDIAKVDKSIARLVKVPLEQHQWDCLSSWTFNLGTGRLATSTLRKKLNAGDYDAVPAQLERWVYAGGRKIQGLINRRKREAKLWMTGDYGL